MSSCVRLRVNPQRNQKPDLLRRNCRTLLEAAVPEVAPKGSQESGKRFQRAVELVVPVVPEGDVDCATEDGCAPYAAPSAAALAAATLFLLWRLVHVCRAGKCRGRSA